MPCLCLDFHAAGQGEHDVVLGVDSHVVYQPAPERLVKFRHHVRQLLHRLDEPVKLPPTDALLSNLLRDLLVLCLGVLEAGCQSLVADAVGPGPVLPARSPR